MEEKEPKEHLAVKRSSAGLGLFTKEPIASGEFIIEYTGKLLSKKEADSSSGRYLFDLDDGKIIDGKQRGNKARYINHACRPNCEIEIECGRIFVYAIKNIKAGSELTYDYGKEYFDEYIKPVGCKCTSCVKKKNKRASVA